jgi:N utilization substance protein B
MNQRKLNSIKMNDPKNSKINSDLKNNNQIKFKKNPRSLSRLLALQILFTDDFFKNSSDVNAIKKELIKNYILHEEYESIDLTDMIDDKFIDQLVFGVKENFEEFDHKIASFLQAKYSLETLDGVELQIFRLAIYELKFLTEIPTNAIINEYVDLASGFYIEKKIKFINGLINALAKELRKA